MWSFPGPMRRGVVQTQIERMVASITASSRDVFNRATSEQVRHVTDVLDWDFTFIEIQITLHVLVSKEVRCAAHDSVKLFETTFDRTEVRQIPQMPLAD